MHMKNIGLENNQPGILDPRARIHLSCLTNQGNSISAQKCLTCLPGNHCAAALNSNNENYLGAHFLEVSQ